MRGPFSFQAELSAVRVERPDGSDAGPRGGYAFATWSLTGESRSYRAESSDFARSEVRSPLGAPGGRGARELGLRLGAFDPDGAAVEGAGRQRSASLVLNGYATRHARALLELGSVRFSDAAPGSPTRVRTATLRLQLAF